MYGMTKPVPAVEFSRVPEKFRKKKRSSWADANVAGMELDAFLEGPSFDRQGNLYVTDIPFGRVFRVSRLHCFLEPARGNVRAAARRVVLFHQAIGERRVVRAADAAQKYARAQHRKRTKPPVHRH